MNHLLRAPTIDELREICELCTNITDPDFDDYWDHLQNASVVIFPRYSTDGPGYQGRVAVIVWPGGPELFDVVCLDGEHKGVMPHDSMKIRIP